MRALVVEREAQAVNRIVELVQSAGFESAGTTRCQQAMAQMESGAVGALVLGGGVTREAREILAGEAGHHGIPVINGALRVGDLREYAEEDLLPQLHTMLQ